MSKLNVSGKNLLQQMRAAIAAEYPDATFTREYDPLIEMAIFAASPELSKAQKFAANREIAQYVYAKRKAVELEGDGEGMRILLVQFSKDGNTRIIDQQPEAIEDQSDDSGIASTIPMDVRPTVDTSNVTPIHAHERFTARERGDDLGRDGDVQ